MGLLKTPIASIINKPHPQPISTKTWRGEKGDFGGSFLGSVPCKISSQSQYSSASAEVEVGVSPRYSIFRMADRDVRDPGVFCCQIKEPGN